MTPWRPRLCAPFRSTCVTVRIAAYLRTYRATIRALGTVRYEDMPAALQDRLLSFLHTQLNRAPQSFPGGSN